MPTKVLHITTRKSPCREGSFLVHFFEIVPARRSSFGEFVFGRLQASDLVSTPLIGLFVASTLQSVLSVVQEKGVKATLLGLFMSFIKLVPGVKKYIDGEKQKVVDNFSLVVTLREKIGELNCLARGWEREFWNK
ncbi:putative sphinganine-1-phosphate aldolase [Rosa chinensis]|uniref:Putative sphinganine-1-phosphate aldolase n=1 Tax=Rosa chinensis TaxID=74649 RepID=A0A2P6QRQ3_ROSCH|nr:putative sphinganine-1-phosphate aldolase [Rosa chinensis]